MKPADDFAQYQCRNGLFNEWCAARWQYLRALAYGLFTWNSVWVWRNYDHRIILVTCGNRTFYNNKVRNGNTT